MCNRAWSSVSEYPQGIVCFPAFFYKDPLEPLGGYCSRWEADLELLDQPPFPIKRRFDDYLRQVSSVLVYPLNVAIAMYIQLLKFEWVI